MAYRISTDIGGTFTDLAIAEHNVLLGRYKSPTTPRDLTQGVLQCLRLVAVDLRSDLKRLLAATDVFIHGSTVATNAILEGKGAKCGVICTRGTKYTLWRGEGRRKDIFNFKLSPREPLVRPYLCLEVTERIDRNGKVLVPLDEEDVRRAVRRLRQSGVASVAVCLLWSIVNPAHERRVGEILREEWPEAFVSLSSEVQPVLREYHRMSCVALNAMLGPVVTNYLRNLESVLAENGFRGELLVVTSDGGVAPVKEASRRPVFMLFSGPATGPSAGAWYAGHESARDCLVIDMGGTSFDVSTVIEGRITTTKDGRILDHPTGVAAVEILTLGAGGGSIAWVDPAGMLMVGPQSAGAEPGPACYMKGGTEPTVTDAYVTLGYIVPDRFLGGRMQISPERPRAAIEEKVARPLGLDVERAALGITKVVNGKMVNGILEMTVRRGIDPRQLLLVTGGGATPVAVASLARELGIRRVVVPRETAVLCAFGSLRADILTSYVASRYAISSAFDQGVVDQALAELELRGRSFLDRLGVQAESRRCEFYCAARYPLQVTELEIPLAANRVTAEVLARLVADFHATHLARYKTADPDSPVEFVMWRHVARAVTPEIELPREQGGGKDAASTRIGTHRMYLEEEGFRDVPYYDLAGMTSGMRVVGPAILVAPDTTIVVPSDVRAGVAERGYVLMEL